MVETSDIQKSFSETTNNLHYIGFLKRLFSFIIDYFIVMVLLLVTIFLGAFFQSLEFLFNIELFGVNALIVIIIWLYFAGMESSALQASVGKWYLRQIVTDLEGKRISFLKASLRFLIKIFIIGSFLAIFTKKKQALHDIIAGTVVISRDVEWEKGKSWIIVAFIILILWLLGKLTP